MSRFTDFFWPTLDKLTPAQLEEDDASEAADIAAARAGEWTQNPELAVEEARRLADSEEDRRRATENKASTYLLFAAAMAAALIPFLPGILENKTGSAPRSLIAFILIVAAVYLMAAGIWAFQTLRVGVYHRLDVAELTEIWRHEHPRRALIGDIFASARMNYRAVNEKVSCIKMAHEFMARSFVAFGILVVVEAGWEGMHSAIETKKALVATSSNGTPELPPVPGRPDSVPLNLEAKPPSSATAIDPTRPAADSSSKPGAAAGATNSGTSTPAQPDAKGSKGSLGDAPVK
jgi:hypothetical protein